MRKRGWIKGGMAILAVAFFLGTWVLPVTASAPRVYVMRGKIVAVDVPDNTVVVNVPLEKKEIFTVAGPLAPDAVLKKGAARNVTLKDFHEGEWVTVKWQHTQDGHLIKALIGK